MMTQRDFIVKHTDSRGNVLFLDPRYTWTDFRYQAKLFAKGHATRMRNIYARHLPGTLGVEKL